MAVNIAQIMQVTSEALQAKIRTLLPSQQGFGVDLQASNVIVPIVDLTATAEGSGLDTDLARALAFGSQTAFSVSNATTTLVNNTGFYRIFGVCNVRSAGGAANSASFQMSDGLTNKTVWSLTLPASGTQIDAQIDFDFTVFLSSGDSISAVSTNAGTIIAGSSRQVADVNGNLINPSGFVAT